MPVHLFDPDARLTVKDADLPGIQQGDPETVYTIRQLDTATHVELIKACTEDKGFDRSTHQRKKELNGPKLSDSLLDYVLVGWTGIVFKGQPVPCVLEHKVKLDALRKAAILEMAGLNTVESPAEVQATSFRGPEVVRGVVDRTSE